MRRVAEFYDRCLDTLDAADLKTYFASLLETHSWSTIKPDRNGLQFFCETLPHSCGHRSCPHCQHHEGQQWLEHQRAKLLPVDYFMVTFTLPRQLRPLAWQHQRLVYDLILKLAWETLSDFDLNDARLQGRIGAHAVLQPH